MGARTKPKPSQSPQVYLIYQGSVGTRLPKVRSGAFRNAPPRHPEPTFLEQKRTPCKNDEIVHRGKNEPAKAQRAALDATKQAFKRRLLRRKKKRADFQGVLGGVPKAPRRLESLQLQCFWRRPSMKRALEKGCRRQRCRAGGGRPGQVPSERPETSTGTRIVPGRLAVNVEASRSLRFSRKT